jgi:hypothetical protein
VAHLFVETDLPLYYQHFYTIVVVVYGTPDWIRTSDLRLRRPLLYPAELRALVIKL